VPSYGTSVTACVAAGSDRARGRQAVTVLHRDASSVDDDAQLDRVACPVVLELINPGALPELAAYVKHSRIASPSDESNLRRPPRMTTDDDE
jgi:hypothetical protein